jgi:hypothetical protein
MKFELPSARRVMARSCTLAAALALLALPLDAPAADAAQAAGPALAESDRRPSAGAESRLEDPQQRGKRSRRSPRRTSRRAARRC